jgi:hypothetical protein
VTPYLLPIPIIHSHIFHRLICFVMPVSPTPFPPLVSAHAARNLSALSGPYSSLYSTYVCVSPLGDINHDTSMKRATTPAPMMRDHLIPCVSLSPSYFHSSVHGCRRSQFVQMGGGSSMTTQAVATEVEASDWRRMRDEGKLRRRTRWPLLRFIRL